VAGWYGGLLPGLLATGLSLLFGHLLLILPRGSIFHHEAFLDTKRLLVFAFTGMLVSILCAKARQGANGRLECLERFRILVESVPGYAILITDRDGRIRCWNTAAERMTGYSERGVLGHDLSIILPEKTSHEEGQRALEIARTVGYCEQEGWQTRKDSSRFWASEVVAALRNQAGQDVRRREDHPRHDGAQAG
jgi:PAS domain S-box-containing protein